MRSTKNGNSIKPNLNREAGFTVVEVIVAGMLMTILCVGTLSVYSYVTRINSGENLRAQALSVLQKEVEYYRSLKFVPIGSSPELAAKTRTKITSPTAPRKSADNTEFDIFITINNISFNPAASTLESDCTFKEIKIEAEPRVARQGWLSNLRTNVTIQRVRSN